MFPKTRRILGVRCTVVRDTVSEHRRAIARTFDWYAPAEVDERQLRELGLRSAVAPQAPGVGR